MSQNVGGFTRLFRYARLLTAVTVVIVAPVVASAQVPFEVLHTFDSNAPFATASLMRAADGNLYITTAGGGSFEGRVVNQGTISRMTPAGAITMLHEFSGGVDGATPAAALLQAADGDFYGATLRGGAYGFGTVFRMTSEGRITTLHSFAGGADGAAPWAPLIQGADGDFYGTTTGGGPEDLGTVYRVTAAGALSILGSFTSASGRRRPTVALVQATDGSFYGVAEGFFKMTPGGVVTSLGTSTNDFLSGPVIQTTDGTLYTTSHGRLSLRATILKLEFVPGIGVFGRPVYSFENAGQIEGLVADANGNFFGTTSYDGSFGRGTVFKVSAAGVQTTLYSFPAVDPADAPRRPHAIVLASDGTFYTTAPIDGPAEFGSVVHVTPSGDSTVLASFVGGRERAGAFSFEGPDGNFYGVSTFGGLFDRGTVYRMTPTGSYSIVHTFGGGAPEGDMPAGLIQGFDGAFYGTTASGGAFGRGTVFRLAADGAVTVLHSFAGGADGAEGRLLIQGTDGSLYGATRRGGLFDGGTAFKLGDDGTTTILHSFQSGVDAPGHIGAQGPGSMLLAADGNFYGTHVFWATGEVFRMTPAGAFTTLYSFHLQAGEYYAVDLPGIVQGKDGNLYGTTFTRAFGHGVGGPGAFYRVSLNGVVTVIRSFEEDGLLNLLGTLVPANDGSFYVTVTGVNGPFYRHLARITTDGATTVLGEIPGSDDLLEATGGFVYGTGVSAQLGGPPFMFRLRVRPPTHRDGDVDGDGKADMTFFRPSDGTWQTRNTRTGATSTVQWGNGLDVPVPGDYDGDGKIDMAVFRPSNGTWYIRYTGTERTAGVQWGNGLDRPVPGDYDGDGTTDMAVFRPSDGVWYLRYSSTGTTAGFQWGNALDVVVPRDYDGDGKTDVAVFRPSNGTWYVRYSATGTIGGVQWGNGLDIPVAADYDGDGIADIAVFRPSNGIWYLRYSGTGRTFGVQWGNGADLPVPADYNGDGKTDVAVYRPSTRTWYVWYSSIAAEGFVWGTSGDMPVLQRR